jgi:hypothetical protein
MNRLKRTVGLILTAVILGMACLPVRSVALVVVTSYISLPGEVLYVWEPSWPDDETAERLATVEKIRRANADWLLRWGRALNYSVSYQYELLRRSADGDSDEVIFSVPLKGVYDRGLDFLPESEVALYYAGLPTEVLHGENAAGKKVTVLRYEGYSPNYWATRFLPSALGQLMEGLSHRNELLPRYALSNLDILVESDSLRITAEVLWRKGTSQEAPFAMLMLEFARDEQGLEVTSYGYELERDYGVDDPVNWWFSDGPGGNSEKWEVVQVWKGIWVDKLLFITETHRGRPNRGLIGRIQDIRVQALPLASSEHPASLGAVYGVRGAFSR